jgi:AcrR family transcriptional regulator
MNERRQQLISAAIRVFASRGFRGATTREIALAAGVTEAVIFQHFPDKDALYAAILEHKAEQQLANDWMADLHEHAKTDNAEALLRTLYTGIIRQHERDPDFVRLTMYSALERHPLSRQLLADGVRLYDCLHGFVLRGQKAGWLRPGRPEVLVRAMLALPIYYVLQRQVFGTPWPAASPEDLIETGVTFALAGLTNISLPARVSAASEPRERSGALGAPRASVQGGPGDEVPRTKREAV